MSAITDYSTLIAAGASQITRDDLAWPLFVQSAHVRIRRELPDVMDVTEASVIPVAGRADLPAGFRGLVALWTDDVGPVSLTSPEIVQTHVRRHAPGLPRWAAIEAEDLIFAPTPPAGTVVRLRFRVEPAMPSATVATNYILTRHPMVYLYGALAEAARKVQDEALVAQYEALFAREIAEIDRAERRRAFAGAVLAPMTASAGAWPP